MLIYLENIQSEKEASANLKGEKTGTSVTVRLLTVLNDLSGKGAATNRKGDKDITKYDCSLLATIFARNKRMQPRIKQTNTKSCIYIYIYKYKYTYIL